MNPNRPRPRWRLGSIFAAAAALLGLGAAQAPAASVPAPAKEYVQTAPQTRRRVKPARKLPPLHGSDPNFPITGDIVPGSCYTFGLGALTPQRLAGYSKADRERLKRAYCEWLHRMRGQPGSQATHRLRRLIRSALDPRVVALHGAVQRRERNARRNERQKAVRDLAAMRRAA